MKGWEHITHMSELEKRCASLWFKINPKEIQGPPIGMLVGEMPGLSTRATLPLFPYPANSSGGRLLKMSKISPTKFLGRVARKNIFLEHRTWDHDDAVESALRIISEIREGGNIKRVVACGQRVAQAFGFSNFFKLEQLEDIYFTAIPHPSGLNRLYNDVNARVGAQGALQWVADCIT